MLNIEIGKGLKVMILSSDKLYDGMFEGMGFTLIDSIEGADLICFTGGSDISPSLYGESAHTRTLYTDRSRDDYESHIFNECMSRKIPMVGICRGAQLLCVLNGGRLVQHINGHCGSDHYATTIMGDETFIVSSSHHQMMVPGGDMGTKVLMVCDKRGNTYLTNGKEIDLTHDIEAVSWVKSRSLGVQFHPEWMNLKARSVKWFSSQLEKLL